MASNEIKISIRRSGAMAFWIIITVDENPANQDFAMEELDKCLFVETNLPWLEYIGGWNTNYKIGISARMIAASIGECQAMLEQWTKICQKKFGNKNLRIEKV